MGDLQAVQTVDSQGLSLALALVLILVVGFVGKPFAENASPAERPPPRHVIVRGYRQHDRCLLVRICQFLGEEAKPLVGCGFDRRIDEHHQVPEAVQGPVQGVRLCRRLSA